MKIENLKKIGLISSIIVIVAIISAPMEVGGVQYSAKVLEGQDTILVVQSCAFGTVSAGNNKTISTFNLTNSGDYPAQVSAKFNTSNAYEVYGLVNGTDNVILASNFSLYIGTDPGNMTALNDSGSFEVLKNYVKPGGPYPYNARLDVPSGQQPGSYYGAVYIVFGNAPIS
ncbi:MAG: hypothetical protein ACE5KT_01530 [Methanosarcinales archaeon]